MVAMLTSHAQDIKADWLSFQVMGILLPSCTKSVIILGIESKEAQFHPKGAKKVKVNVLSVLLISLFKFFTAQLVKKVNL